MATALLPLIDVDAGERTRAFQRLLDRLPVVRPKQLVLVNPQLVPEAVYDLAAARNGGYYAYPPVGLLYLAAVARSVIPDLDIRIIDLNIELLRRSQEEGFEYRVWQDLLAEALKGCDAPHIAVTYMFGSTKTSFVDVCHFLRERYPDAPILAGGVQCSYDFEEVLEAGLADVVFRREGEGQLEAFLRSCVAGEPVAIPEGAAFLLDGKVYPLGTPKEDVPVEWDIRPYYDLIPTHDYYRYGSLGAFSRYNGAEKPFATVLGNRGCRARCTFCTVRDFNGFGIRQRSVQSVIDEIKFLVREKGIQQIDWLDDDLLWNPKRAVELFKGLAEQVPELEWTCSNGLIAVAATEEIMYWMVKSGLKAFKIGIESGNDEMLHLIKKPTTKPKLRERRELFRKYPEVLVSANFIIGFPNETFGQMMDTYDFACELEWDWSSFYICQPLKGTEMFSSFQELGDDRCKEERYEKTLNPGRASQRGEFGYRFLDEANTIRRGRDVFDIPRDSVPNLEQQKEIWFTFNFIGNFVNNPNFQPGGRPEKIARWFEAIHSGYPYDASMAAALVRAYRMMGDQERAQYHQKRVGELIEQSEYWQQRVEQFPELLTLAGLD